VACCYIIEVTAVFGARLRSGGESVNNLNHLRKAARKDVFLDRCTVMEGAVHARLTLLFALLATAAIAPAEPPKVSPSKAQGQQQARRAPIALASAEPVRAPVATAESATATPKRVIPRVTTCRCGDPQPTPESDEQ
jgi:hypothetical protein